MKLIHSNTGKVIQVGDVVTSFRGETATVTDIREPAHPGSSGRIYVKWDAEKIGCEYFPGVFNCAWVQS